MQRKLLTNLPPDCTTAILINSSMMARLLWPTRYVDSPRIIDYRDTIATIIGH